MSDIEIDLSTPLNGKCEGVADSSTYGFLLVNSSNICPNSAPFWAHGNMSELDYHDD